MGFVVAEAPPRKRGGFLLRRDPGETEGISHGPEVQGGRGSGKDGDLGEVLAAKPTELRSRRGGVRMTTKRRQSKGPERRPRKSARGTGRTGSSSTPRKTQPSSASKGGEGGGRTFSIKATKNPSTLVSEAKKVAKENNATFKGDTTSGSFSGKGVKGRYKIEGGTVKVTITDKPTLAPWSTVESKVKEFF